MRCFPPRSILPAPLWAALALGGASLVASSAAAQERRAPPPTFSSSQTRGVFFDQLDDAIRGSRPDLASLRSVSNTPAPSNSDDRRDGPSSGDGEDGWAKIVAATTLEDEVKRVRLAFDATVTTPGAFASGGYQTARDHLSVLAMAFAVINEFDGDVRWKDEAPVARDLIARSAANCKAGSNQVYNEVKLRQQDLQDLVSGAGLQGRDADPENEWFMIVDRAPMMSYAQRLLDRMQDASRSAAAVEEAGDSLVRDSEMLAVVGRVLHQEGMIDADDEDYAKLSAEMTRAARGVAVATRRGDADAVRTGVGAVSQSCVACHDMYR